MSIIFDDLRQILTLHTKNTTYQMKIDPLGFLLHLYYGRRLIQSDMSYIHMRFDRANSGNPDEAYPDRTISADTMPQEYSGYGVGDYRIHGIAVVNADGSRSVDWRYTSHEIRKGKYSIQGLPACYDNGDEAETLVVKVADKVTGLTAELYYGVFEEKDIITRAVRITNAGEKAISLEKAASMTIDFPYGNWEMIHFHGKHALERQPERKPLTHSIQTAGSSRGTSSHQQNPFVILCDENANEDYGLCYGFMLVYSGGFKVEAEVDQFDSTRVVMGIQDQGFSWNLDPEESFLTPEVIISCSSSGITALSHQFHRIIRENICRGKYKYERRPVLLNNWEATYFDFTDQKILRIADEAADLGIEMLVLDDGWFGDRNDDNAGLGDWFVNENKIRCGLHSLADQINERGLKFGIWLEPEMVNEDSDLYRSHPDWVLAMPGRKPVRSRNQLVLDMSRQEVREYLYERISTLLSENRIDYVKWDMNRSLSDVYSSALPSGKQGEVHHRYVLGLYDLLERLTSDFPNVLFEGCSGGGARYDAGIMYYCPQIWCSDDTDPIHRLHIQYGSSFGYPVSTVGAHVSASPNHQTGRATPINTRAIVAMSGTFGFELDPGALTENDRKDIRKQLDDFKKYYSVIQQGLYYRLTTIHKDYYEAWEFVSEDKREALLNVVITNPQPNPTLIHINLKGLDPLGVYEVKGKTKQAPEAPFIVFGSADMADRYNYRSEEYTGNALMFGGYTLPWIIGDYPALQIHFVRTRTLGID